jgi:polyisoprenyl-phosphate glycosyltransferase
MRAEPAAGPARSLVVPMYREALRIDRTIEQLAASPLGDGRTELLFVDDGSPDGTPEVTERALARTGLAARVIRLPRKVGKGGRCGRACWRRAAP